VVTLDRRGGGVSIDVSGVSTEAGTRRGGFGSSRLPLSTIDYPLITRSGPLRH
jgi:hypothetical protein